MSSLAEKFSSFLDSAKVEIKYLNTASSKNYCMINDHWMSPKKTELMLRSFSSVMEEHPEVFVKFSRQGGFQELMSSYSEHYGIPKAPSPEEAATSESVLKFIQATKNYKVVVDLIKTSKSGMKQYVVLNSLDEPTMINAGVWADAHSFDLGSAMPHVLEYRPDIPSRFFTPVGSDVAHLNTYVMPPWQKLDRPTPKAPPKDFQALLGQIENKMDRKYFLHWLGSCLLDRASSYLIIHGAGGGGKSKLKAVLMGLVGKANYSSGKKSTLTTNFNSQLVNKKLLAFDELKYDMDNQNTMKELPNNLVAIEAKGMDPVDKKIHASLLIINNHLQDNYIPYDSRKFCPIGFSETRLETYLKPEEIAALELKSDEDSDKYDPEWLADIGNWVMENGLRPDLFPQGEYKGPKYWQICDSSMSIWQKTLIEYIKDPITKFGVQIGTPIKEKLDKFQMPCSELQAAIIKKTYRESRVIFPKSQSTSYIFLKHYRDLDGKEVIKISDIFNPSIADFYIGMKNESAEDSL